jgi:hypothetical protein
MGGSGGPTLAKRTNRACPSPRPSPREPDRMRVGVSAGCRCSSASTIEQVGKGTLESMAATKRKPCAKTQPRSLYSTQLPCRARSELTNRALLAGSTSSRARRSGRGLEGGWPCRLRAASAASHHQRPGRPWALRCNLGLPTDNTHIEALLTFMKPPPPHHLDLPILTRFRTIRSLKRCLTMAQYHVRQHHYSSRI